MFSGLSVVACHCESTGDWGPVRASVHLSRVLAGEQGSHLPYTSDGTGSVSNAILTIRKVPGWHILVVPLATEVAVRAVLVGSRIGGRRRSDDPVSNSAVTGALVAGRAGHVKEGEGTPPG